MCSAFKQWKTETKYVVVEELCNKEVEELHEFFTDWFNGKRNMDFNRLQRVLDKDFKIISPNSHVTSKEELLSNMRKSYNSRSNIKIWVENVDTRNIGANVYLTTYHELQQHNDEITRRVSSAVFHTNAKCPNSVSWLHVHETWIRD